MKIVCPEHDGIIEIPDDVFVNAVNSPLKQLVFTCPVCEDEILFDDSDSQALKKKKKPEA
ncbi:hypothetical protein GS399_06250 [Pedobacter sp. HMF7647]|uniref:CPXCG motif-containing cysteine-rich protein n=1 Tax=Hufsiella arboris TaxID=2695275 RepID=A0A7K1Y910_9SPHI|nr:hypothetical protein [Hufsiella arboris]MXV50569.1 hypothetical protein [Hufsiella arboris]